MKNEALAVIVLTYNEERHIAECIRSIGCKGEVLLIDSFSTDNTVAIAQEMGARVVQKKMTAGFAEQRNFALGETDAEWVLFLDADERMTPELCVAIERVISSGKKAAVYELRRVNYAFGERVRFGEFGSDSVLRFFPKNMATWEGLVHESLCTALPQELLPGHLIHHTYLTWERYFDKFNKYTTMMARKNHDCGKRASFVKVIANPPWAFFRAYFLRLGFLDGKIGFILAAFHFFYTMAKYVKLYYLESYVEEN